MIFLYKSIIGLLILVGLSWGLLSYFNEPSKLKEGDLLFQDLNCGELCDAIEGVTEGRNGQDFSHCAIVIEHEGNLVVAEAIGRDVHTTPIDSFLARKYADSSKTLVLRLPEHMKNMIPKVSEFVIQQLGKPYDEVFEMDNGKYYCSELIYDAFKYAQPKNQLLSLSPMTFKDPKTDSIMQVWVDYYKSLQTEIPEGKPGINPGYISRQIWLVELDDIKNDEERHNKY